MPLTDAQKAQVRRHLKYDVIGLPIVSPGGAAYGQASAGYRYFTAYGRLEWRMNALSPSEEAILLGVPFGGVAFVGGQPNPGDTVSVTFAATGVAAQTITTPPFSATGVDGRLQFAQQIVSLTQQNSILRAFGLNTYTPYGTGPFAATAVPLPEVGFTAPAIFTLSATGTGVITPQITSQGNFVPPSTSLDGGKTTIFGFLNILNGLEFAYGAASDNLDTAQADVWKARSNELGLRMSLYETWVGQMSDFLGVPVNPQRRRSNDPRRHRPMAYA